MAEGLPPFVRPMLATLGRVFDSPDHLFEIKWDGFRALAFTDRDATRLLSRNNNRLHDRFPEMGFLQGLERGLVLDGELVALKAGKPEFSRLLSRASPDNPAGVTYVVFDLLYEGFEPVTSSPLEERRARLRAVVARARHPRLVFSDSLQGIGTDLYERACREGLEGIVAKRLSSRYLPGKRSDAWVKIKRTQQAYCAVIGFLDRGGTDFRSLAVALDDEDGHLTYVGAVGTGFSEAVRERINAFLWANLRSAPVVPCPISARWVEPGLICLVEFPERTPAGLLRTPVFKGIAAA